MGRLSFARKVSLSGIHDNWTDEHYVELSTAKFADFQEFVNKGEGAGDEVTKIMSLLKKCFISGKVLVDNKTVPMEADDIDDLPQSVINKLIENAIGTADPK